MTSLPARPQYKGRREDTSFACSSEACIRSMAHSLGDTVSRSQLGEHGYMCNPRCSPSWELQPASPRGRYVERYTHAAILRGVQANVAQRRALSQLYQAEGVAPGTVDAVSDIIPFGQKPNCIPAKEVGPKAQTWAWPAQIRARSCAGNPTLWYFRKNAEYSMCELTTGWILEKYPKSSVCTYHNMDFRKNAKHLMCELTTEWIFRKCLALSVCTYIYFWYYVLWFGSGELLIPWSERELRHSEGERHSHRRPSMVRGAMLAWPTRRATYHQTLESGETQTLRKERHAHRWPSRLRGAMLALPITISRSKGSGMLIGDPLGEGSKC